MKEVFLYTILSVIIVSLISFIGILTISLKEKLLNKILILFVSFSAGALIAGAIVHLLPEAFKRYGINLNISIYFLIGILVFFLLEKLLCWRHCHVHNTKRYNKRLAYMNLVGDFFHNFIDGMIIAGSYLANIQLGITTTLAVILHEIPQEIGDFGVLLYSGLKKYRALLYNFLSALAAILGAIIILAIGKTFDLTAFLLPFTAGGFMYIAGSDLIPELQKEFKIKKSLIQFLFLVLGMLVMLGFIFLE